MFKHKIHLDKVSRMTAYEFMDCRFKTSARFDDKWNNVGGYAIPIMVSCNGENATFILMTIQIDKYGNVSTNRMYNGPSTKEELIELMRESVNHRYNLIEGGIKMAIIKKEFNPYA